MTIFEPTGYTMTLVLWRMVLPTLAIEGEKEKKERKWIYIDVVATPTGVGWH